MRRFRIINIQAKDSIEAYAKVSCRDLCTKFYSTLPRELRDGVYKYISPGSTVHVDLDNEWIPDDECYFSNNPVAPVDSLGSSHYWNPEFVGNEFAKELAESWYSTTNFSVRDCRDLDEFLSEDRWQHGLIPSHFVSSIQVTTACPNYPYPTVTTEHQQAREQSRKLLMEAFAKLSRLKSSAKIAIELQSAYLPDYWNERGTIPGLETFDFVFPALTPLRDHGYRIDLSVGVYCIPFRYDLVTPQDVRDAFILVSPLQVVCFQQPT